MRTISLSTRQALNAQETSAIPIFLFTIDHESLAEVIRLSTDPTERLQDYPEIYGTTSRGNDFTFMPINMILPDDEDQTPPSFRVSFDNVLRDLIPTIRSISTPPSVTVEMVMASDPDTVETEWPNFDMVNVEYDANTVTVDLVIDSLVHEPYPYGTFTPSGFGGLF